MTWVQNLLDDENVFPTKAGASPSPSLLPLHVLPMLLRLRVSVALPAAVCHRARRGLFLFLFRAVALIGGYTRAFVYAEK